jgi:3-methyladenine DNA glycosylase Tag
MNRYIGGKPTSLSGYLESMSRAVFTAGMSWDVVDARWAGMRQAFDGFDPKKVAAYGPDDIDRLMKDPAVIHNQRKIDAVVRNAGELLVLDKQPGGIEGYLESFDDNDELVRDLHKRFAFLGESVAHFFLFGIAFKVPEQTKWAEKHFAGVAGHHW